ncbi:hypothetical protein [Leclercia pneumoniae]
MIVYSIKPHAKKYKKQPLHFFVKLVVYSAALTKV